MSKEKEGKRMKEWGEAMDLNKFETMTSVVVAFGGTIVNYFLGGWDLALKTMILFMALDYILGVICGGKKKTLSSQIAFNGILKKVAILFVIAVGVALDNVVGAQGILRSLVLFFYIGLEGISILENAASLGVPIPEKLKDSLSQLKEGNKKAIIEDMEQKREGL